MNINRDNYEECFILYVDNELPVTAKKLVEEFVKDNPDLEDELVMLQQSKLVPDRTILFDGKEFLMKENTVQYISLSNYQEYLLLYIDNELSIEQKIKVEEFVAPHPGLQKELELLQRTRVQSEEGVVFQDKELLYRKEKYEKVFRFGWLKIAAAAIVISAVAVSTFILMNNNSVKPGNGVVAIEATDANKKVETFDNTKKDNNRVIQASGNNNSQKAIATATKPNIAKPGKRINDVVRKNLNSMVANNNNGNISLIKNNEQNVNTDIVVNIERTTTPATIMDMASTPKSDPKQIINKSGVTTEIPESYDIADGSNKKLRGFFRKATRIFERTTNINATNEDNKLLVGAFAINLN